MSLNWAFPYKVSTTSKSAFKSSSLCMESNMYSQRLPFCDHSPTISTSIFFSNPCNRRKEFFFRRDIQFLFNLSRTLNICKILNCRMFLILTRILKSKMSQYFVLYCREKFLTIFIIGNRRLKRVILNSKKSPSKVLSTVSELIWRTASEKVVTRWVSKEPWEKCVEGIRKTEDFSKGVLLVMVCNFWLLIERWTRRIERR